MKEVRLNYNIQANAEIEKNRLVADLLKNEKVLGFLKDNNLNDEFVNKYAYKLKRWLNGIFIR